MGKQAYRVVSSEFGVVRPHRTSSNHCDVDLQGSFEWVRGGSTTPNLLEPLWCRPTGKFWMSSRWFDLTKPLWCRGKQTYRAVSSEFGVVRPHRTSSNHCDADLQGSFEWVRGGLTSPNLCDGKSIWRRKQRLYTIPICLYFLNSQDF